jgi:hypothetical protein
MTGFPHDDFSIFDELDSEYRRAAREGQSAVGLGYRAGKSDTPSALGVAPSLGALERGVNSSWGSILREKFGYTLRSVVCVDRRSVADKYQIRVEIRKIAP